MREIMFNELYIKDLSSDPLTLEEAMWSICTEGVDPLFDCEWDEDKEKYLWRVEIKYPSRKVYEGNSIIECIIKASEGYDAEIFKVIK